MQLPGGPVAEQAAGVEQAVEQADDAIVMQLDAGHAAGTNSHGLRQRGQGAGVDGGVEQFRLLFEVAVGGGGQALLERRQVGELATDIEVVGVVQASLGT